MEPTRQGGGSAAAARERATPQPFVSAPVQYNDGGATRAAIITGINADDTVSLYVFDLTRSFGTMQVTYSGASGGAPGCWNWAPAHGEVKRVDG